MENSRAHFTRLICPLGRFCGLEFDAESRLLYSCSGDRHAAVWHNRAGVEFALRDLRRELEKGAHAALHDRLTTQIQMLERELATIPAANQF